LKLPNRCYITFEYEKTKSEFLEKFEGSGKIKLQGFESKKIKIQEAHEPSDLIWEKMNTSSKLKQSNSAITFFKIMIILFVIFALMTFMFTSTYNVLMKYPSSVSCDDLSSGFNVQS
jgi:hypothetical protein